MYTSNSVLTCICTEVRCAEFDRGEQEACLITGKTMHTRQDHAHEATCITQQTNETAEDSRIQATYYRLDLEFKAISKDSCCECKSSHHEHAAGYACYAAMIQLSHTCA